jgi:hypothetical protein
MLRRPPRGDMRIHLVQNASGDPALIGAWPERVELSDGFLRACETACEPLLHMRWPYLVVQVVNGHAVYRVSTCELGRWRGELLEASLTAPIRTPRSTRA